MEVLNWNQVQVTLNGRRVLNSLNLHLKKGEFLFVLGRSGVGKSVLLKTTLGLLPKQSGEILYQGQSESIEQFRTHCGMVFQHPALIDTWTIEKNLECIRYVRKAKLTCQEVIESVGLSEGVLSKFPRTLSYGEQKRVSIARVLLLQPEIVFYDEPTTSLDPLHSRKLFDRMSHLTKAFSQSTLVVSHDIPNAFQYADRIAVLEEGKILEEGTPKQLLSTKNLWIQKFLKAGGVL